jgi:hypothetical protein
MVRRIIIVILTALPCSVLIGTGYVQAQQSPGGGAAVIAYPSLALFREARSGAGKIADIPFASRVFPVAAAKGRRAAPVIRGGMRKVRWRNLEGWVERASLLPGADLSPDDIPKKDLEACGPCCEKFLRRASASLRHITPGDLRPARVPYSLKSLMLKRREGETPCAEFAGSLERLEIRGGAVKYTHCLGGGSGIPCDGGGNPVECENLALQDGTCEFKGTHLLVKLRPGLRKEYQCRNGKPVKEESPVRAASLRLHWIGKFNCFMTDDELSSFNYSNTCFNSRDRSFMSVMDGLKSHLCDFEGKAFCDADASCYSVLERLLKGNPYRFTDYFRKTD